VRISSRALGCYAGFILRRGNTTTCLRNPASGLSRLNWQVVILRPPGTPWVKDLLCGNREMLCPGGTPAQHDTLQSMLVSLLEYPHEGEQYYSECDKHPSLPPIQHSDEHGGNQRYVAKAAGTTIQDEHGWDGEMDAEDVDALSKSSVACIAQTVDIVVVEIGRIKHIRSARCVRERCYCLSVLNYMRISIHRNWTSFDDHCNRCFKSRPLSKGESHSGASFAEMAVLFSPVLGF
jgi:hypothetical protein